MLKNKTKKKIAVIVQCRQSSTRLNKKLLLKLGSYKVIDILLSRMKKINSDLVICAVAKEPGNKSLLKAIRKNNVKIYEGSKNNVLLRTYLAAKKFKVNTIVRITSDCPIIDPKLVNIGIKIFRKKKLDFLSNNLPPSWPHGVDFEIFSFNILKKSLERATTSTEKEHVTVYMRKNKNLRKFNLKNPTKLNRYYRWTIDTKLDFIFFKKLFRLRPQLKTNFNWKDLFIFLKKNNLQSINTSSHHFNFKD